jgi:cell shape-determining protein MreD
MISRTIFTDILIIAFLIAFQIFVLNRIIIMGKFTPVLYPVFVIFYPFFRNKYHMLVASFVLGLGIDAFLYTWGINAFATTLVAYYRSSYSGLLQKLLQIFLFQTLQWSQFLFFIFSAIFLHQFVVQYLEFFKLTKFFETFVNVLVTSVISFIFMLLYALLFKIKQKV